MNEHYAAVLTDLNARRQPIVAEIDILAKKLAEIDSLIAAIQMHGRTTTPNETGSLFGMTAPTSVREMYTSMSMRWAILYMLAEHTAKTLTTAEIGSRLIGGGFLQSPNFNSKVSAILSQMFTRGEVEKAEMGWAISSHGETVWQNIKAGEKFLNRHNSGNVDLE